MSEAFSSGGASRFSRPTWAPEVWWGITAALAVAVLVPLLITHGTQHSRHTASTSPPPTVAQPAALADQGSISAPVAGPTVPTPSHAVTSTYVVAPGDTLWKITARHLGARATQARVGASWPAIYARNRAVIGADPSMLRPGEVLHL